LTGRVGHPYFGFARLGDGEYVGDLDLAADEAEACRTDFLAAKTTGEENIGLTCLRVPWVSPICQKTVLANHIAS